MTAWIFALYWIAAVPGASVLVSLIKTPPQFDVPVFQADTGAPGFKAKP